MIRTLKGVHAPFCYKPPKYHTFLNSKILHNRPHITIKFKERD